MFLTIVFIPILLGLLNGAALASHPLLFIPCLALTVFYFHEMLRPGGILDQFNLTERP